MECSATDWISAIASMIQAFAVIVGLWLAYVGLDQWKRQLVWSKNSELAEAAMLAAYGFRDTLARVRSSVSWTDEGASRPQSGSEAEEVKKHLDYKFIPIERLDRERPAFAHFFEAYARCRVRFPKVMPHLDVLRQALVDIQSGAQVRMEMARKDPYQRRQGNEGDIEFVRKLDGTVMSVGTDTSPDELGERIEGAVSGLAEALREYVKEVP